MEGDNNCCYVYDHWNELLSGHRYNCFTISGGRVVDNAQTLGELDSRLEVLEKIGIVKDTLYLCNLGPEPVIGR